MVWRCSSAPVHPGAGGADGGGGAGFGLPRRHGHAGKDTLDQLEETRTELARVQVAANTGNKSQELWAGEQAGWRRERETSRIEAEARQLGWRRRRPVNPRF